MIQWSAAELNQMENVPSPGTEKIPAGSHGISLGPRIVLFENRGSSWDLKDEAGASKDYIGYHNPIRTDCIYIKQYM